MDEAARAEVEGIARLRDDTGAAAGAPWRPAAFSVITLVGPVGPYRRGPAPASGWIGYADWRAGHLPRAGGLYDQSAIWVATVRACAAIHADLEAWLARERRAKRPLTAPSLHPHRRSPHVSLQ